MSSSFVSAPVGCQPVVFQVGHLGKAYWEWVNKPDPGQPRFFGNGIVENCSKTPWWVVPLIWLPIFSWCSAHAYLHHGLPVAEVVSWLLVGIVAWQLLEYLIHRFIFHATFDSYWGITFHFLFHGCHHKYPMDKERLVFPPVPASALVGAIFYTLHKLLPPAQATGLFAGMGFGYVLYDCLHYAIHYHRHLPSPMFQELRSRHYDHHFRDHSKGYGISSVMFDVLLGTARDST